MEYSGDDVIVSMTVPAVIRARPHLFVGALDQPSAVSSLLQEAMCLAIEDCLKGLATKITITRHKDYSFSVWDNGQPLAPTKRLGGIPAYEMLFTHMHACRDLKQHAREVCTHGLVTTNALSAWLTIDVALEGQHWHQRYVQGEPESDIHVAGMAESQWRQISFLPDRLLFADIQFPLPIFFSWFHANSSGLCTCEVVFVDQVNQESIQLLPNKHQVSI